MYKLFGFFRDKKNGVLKVLSIFVVTTLILPYSLILSPVRVAIAEDEVQAPESSVNDSPSEEVGGDPETPADEVVDETVDETTTTDTEESKDIFQIIGEVLGIHQEESVDENSDAEVDFPEAGRQAQNQDFDPICHNGNLITPNSQGQLNGHINGLENGVPGHEHDIIPAVDANDDGVVDNADCAFENNDGGEGNDEDSAYCGDGILDEAEGSWEQCDNGELNGTEGNSCTAQCQIADQCNEMIFARVVVDDVQNLGSGDMTEDVYVGGSDASNVVPAGTWFPIHDGTDWINDGPVVDNYEDVPGFAVERQDGAVKLMMHGSHNKNEDPGKEHADGYIEFFQADPLDPQVSDPAQNKVEKPFDGNNFSGYLAGDDSLEVSDSKSKFWLTVTTADDAFTTNLESTAPVCEEDDTATISATKIVCPTEDLLPNWGYGPDMNITSETASDFIAENPTCHLEPWTFEWAPSETPNPGDNILGAASGDWTSFTDTASVPVGEGEVWVREQMKDGYVPFSGDTTDPRDDNVSAEIYCNSDVLNYDNYDWIGLDSPMVAGETYYCVAFNAPQEVEQICDPQANLIQNGSFENNEVTTDAHWDIFSNGTPLLAWIAEWLAPSGAPEIASVEHQENGLSTWTAQSGTQWAELDGDYYGPTNETSGESGSSKIHQDITTIPGKTYNLSYYFSPRPDQTDLSGAENKLEVTWDGTLIDTAGPTAGNGSTTVWEHRTKSIVATDTTTTLAFADAGTPSDSLGTFLDNVSLTCVPEVEPICGDGIKNGDEQCDGTDGTLEGQTCNDQCLIVPSREYGPYCGDGIPGNQDWEQCDNGALNGTEGNNCSAQCQSSNECIEENNNKLAFAKITITNVVNEGAGDMTTDVFVGGNDPLVNKIPSGTWFLINDGNGAIVDPSYDAAVPYDTGFTWSDVPGLAVERQDGFLRTNLFARWPAKIGGYLGYEHAEGTIEYFNTAPIAVEGPFASNDAASLGGNPATQYSDPFNNPSNPKGWKLEAWNEGTFGNPGTPGNPNHGVGATNDEIWTTPDGVQHFWIGAGQASDSFFNRYDTNIETCEDGTGGDGDGEVDDQCPDIGGVQETNELCPPTTGGGDNDGGSGRHSNGGSSGSGSVQGDSTTDGGVGGGNGDPTGQVLGVSLAASGTPVGGYMVMALILMAFTILTDRKKGFVRA